MITEQSTGGVLQPAELCNKTGERLMEVLCTKHSEAYPPTAASLDTYPDRPPEFVPVDITDDTVTEMAGRIYVGSGPGGDGISEPRALVPAFRSDEQGAVADCCRLRGVFKKWASPVGRLPSYNEQPDDCTGQAARVQSGQGKRNLVAADGEVFTTCDGAGGQGRMWDRAASRRHRSLDRGSDPFYAPHMGTALPRGGLEDSSSSMRVTPSMMRTGQQFFGISGIIGPAARSLPLTAAVTGPLWWCVTQSMGQATYCKARKA